MKELIPVLMLLAGAAVGLLSSLVASAIQHRRSLEVKLLEQYFVARQSAAELLAPLTNADVLSAMPHEEMRRARDAVAILYYRHFDFLPIEVLNSLVRLQTAIDYPHLGPISMQNGIVSPMSDADIPAFIEECYLIKNGAFFACMALNAPDSESRRVYVIKLHAQHSLFQLNRFASLEMLGGIEKTMRKSR